MITQEIHAPRFGTVYDHENTTVVDEDGYHQMEQGCGCARTTASGAYRDVTVDLADGSRAFYYHQTPVVVADAARRRFRLDSGGYRTMTTKARMNRHTPRGVRVYQRDFDWFVEVGGETREFEDGMTVEVAA